MSASTSIQALERTFRHTKRYQAHLGMNLSRQTLSVKVLSYTAGYLIQQDTDTSSRKTRSGLTKALNIPITNVYHAIVYADAAASSKGKRGVQEGNAAHCPSTRRSTPRAGKIPSGDESQCWLEEKIYKGGHTKTPNILAMSQRLPETRDQYLSSSFCAPSTLSTTSSLW